MCGNSLVYENNDQSYYEYCSKLAPFSRVLFISSERFFLLHGKKILSKLFNNQLSVTTVLYKGFKKFSTHLASGLFNVADDVRLCIAFEKELFSLCFYFASIKKIPAFVNTKSEYLDFALEKSTSFGSEVFNFYDKRYVYVENKTNSYESYSSIVIKRLSLIDYNIKCIIHKKKYKDEYFSALKIFNSIDYKYPKLSALFEIDKDLSLLNFNSGGELFNSGAISLTKKFYNLSSLESLFLSKEYFSKIEKEINKNNFNILNYNLRAEKLSYFMDLNADEIRKNIKKQLSILNQNKLLAKLAFKLLTISLKEILEFIDVAIDVCYKLGAKEKKISEKQNVFNFLSCDNLSFFNSATLFREFSNFSV